MLITDTGNEKLDTAYNNLSSRIDLCNDAEEFITFFYKTVKTEDKEIINKWLLKVLFVQIKYVQSNIKQKDKQELDELTKEFMQLCSLLNKEQKAKVESFVKNNLEKVKG